MKNIKLFTLLFAIGLSAALFFAEATERTQNLPSGTTVVLKSRGKLPKGRPGMPSRQIINCTYDSGELTIDFTIPEGMCEVLLTEASGMTMSYTVDSSNLTATVFVGTISDSEIELSTESGNTYSGTLTYEE